MIKFALFGNWFSDLLTEVEFGIEKLSSLFYNFFLER